MTPPHTYIQPFNDARLSLAEQARTVAAEVAAHDWRSDDPLENAICLGAAITRLGEIIERIGMETERRQAVGQ